MNLAETHDLLTFIAAYDNRRFDDATVFAWQPIFADVPYGDARTAVTRHFASSTDYLMPVHVRRLAEDLDRDRRKAMREAREHLAIESEQSDPTRRDRSDEVNELMARLRDSLPDGDPDKLRRAEWIELDRRRGRAVELNPGFVAPPPPGGHPMPDVA